MGFTLGAILFSESRHGPITSSELKVTIIAATARSRPSNTGRSRSVAEERRSPARSQVRVGRSYPPIAQAVAQLFHDKGHELFSTQKTCRADRTFPGSAGAPLIPTAIVQPQ